MGKRERERKRKGTGERKKTEGKEREREREQEKEPKDREKEKERRESEKEKERERPVEGPGTFPTNFNVPKSKLIGTEKKGLTLSSVLFCHLLDRKQKFLESFETQQHFSKVLMSLQALCSADSLWDYASTLPQSEKCFVVYLHFFQVFIDIRKLPVEFIFFLHPDLYLTIFYTWLVLYSTNLPKDIFSIIITEVLSSSDNLLSIVNSPNITIWDLSGFPLHHWSWVLLNKNRGKLNYFNKRQDG